MDTTTYIAQDAVGLAGLVASGEVSAPEVTEAAIAVIEELNPRLNAVIRKDYERARAAAAQVRRGPLAGVPFLLKDVNLYSETMPTTWGSRYLADAAPRPDSIMVRQWREAGLIILGKTNTPEFAAEYITEPAAYGRTVNPLDPSVTVGGSSGGAAAAVAAGMVPIAHATDLGGSIRVPAACCGLYGFKPTAGLNSNGPYFAQVANGLNSDHVLTRSVRDSAASLDITAPVAGGKRGFLAAHAEAPGRLRILATIHSGDGVAAGPNQIAAVERACALFRDCGHEVHLSDTPVLTPVGEWFDPLWIEDIPRLMAEHASETGRSPGPDELEPMTREILAIFDAMGADTLTRARESKARTTARHLALFADWDILLTPSLGTDPAPLGTLGYGDLGSMRRWAEAGYAFAPFSIIANVTGQPAASLPLPMDGQRIPVGIQIMAAPGRDLMVLQLSHQFEAATGGPRRAVR